MRLETKSRHQTRGTECADRQRQRSGVGDRERSLETKSVDH